MVKKRYQRGSVIIVWKQVFSPNIEFVLSVSVFRIKSITPKRCSDSDNNQIKLYLRIFEGIIKYFVFMLVKCYMVKSFYER